MSLTSNCSPVRHLKCINQATRESFFRSKCFYVSVYGAFVPCSVSCVVGMGVDGVCQRFRSDGGAEKKKKGGGGNTLEIK